MARDGALRSARENRGIGAERDADMGRIGRIARIWNDGDRARTLGLRNASQQPAQPHRCIIRLPSGVGRTLDAAVPGARIVDRVHPLPVVPGADVAAPGVDLHVDGVENRRGIAIPPTEVTGGIDRGMDRVRIGITRRGVPESVRPILLGHRKSGGGVQSRVLRGDAERHRVTQRLQIRIG